MPEIVLEELLMIDHKEADSLPDERTEGALLISEHLGTGNSKLWQTQITGGPLPVPAHPPPPSNSA